MSKYHDFESLEDIKKYIEESFINGQRKQAIGVFKEMPIADRKGFIKEIVKDLSEGVSSFDLSDLGVLIDNIESQGEDFDVFRVLSIHLAEDKSGCARWILENVKPAYADQLLNEDLYTMDLETDLVDDNEEIPEFVKEFISCIERRDGEVAYIRIIK